MGWIRVTVKLFAALRRHVPDYDPENGIDVEMKEASSIEDLVETLQLPKDEAKIVLVNGVSRETIEPIKDGDEISIFSPIAGGSLAVPSRFCPIRLLQSCLIGCAGEGV